MLHKIKNFSPIYFASVTHSKYGKERAHTKGFYTSNKINCNTELNPWFVILLEIVPLSKLEMKMRVKTQNLRSDCWCWVTSNEIKKILFFLSLFCHSMTVLRIRCVTVFRFGWRIIHFRLLISIGSVERLFQCQHFTQYEMK